MKIINKENKKLMYELSISYFFALLKEKLNYEISFFFYELREVNAKEKESFGEY